MSVCAFCYTRRNISPGRSCYRARVRACRAASCLASPAITVMTTSASLREPKRCHGAMQWQRGAPEDVLVHPLFAMQGLLTCFSRLVQLPQGSPGCSRRRAGVPAGTRRLRRVRCVDSVMPTPPTRPRHLPTHSVHRSHACSHIQTKHSSGAFLATASWLLSPTTMQAQLELQAILSCMFNGSSMLLRKLQVQSLDSIRSCKPMAGRHMRCFLPAPDYFS